MSVLIFERILAIMQEAMGSDSSMEFLYCRWSGTALKVRNAIG